MITTNSLRIQTLINAFDRINKSSSIDATILISDLNKQLDELTLHSEFSITKNKSDLACIFSVDLDIVLFVDSILEHLYRNTQPL